MTPIIPGPDPIALPAPVALLKVLLVGTLPLHLLPMNLALGGGFVAAWAAWRQRRSAELESRRYRALGATLTTPLLVATAFTITLGIAPLLFLQVLYGPLFYTASVLMAWWWLAVIGLLMAGYYSYYAFAFRPRWNGAAHLMVLGGALLLAVVGFLFTNNMTLMLHPERWAAMYAASEHGTHLNVADPTHGPRYLHFLMASFAVTGLFIAWRGRHGTSDEAGYLRRFGARLFAGATHLQLLVGLAFLLLLPAPVRGLFLGGSVLDTVVLWSAVAAALTATFIVRRSAVVATGLLVSVVMAMAFVRHRVREGFLAPYFSTDQLAVEPQYGLLAAFAALLLAGIATLVWMGARFVRKP